MLAIVAVSIAPRVPLRCWQEQVDVYLCFLDCFLMVLFGAVYCRYRFPVLPMVRGSYFLCLAYIFNEYSQ